MRLKIENKSWMNLSVLTIMIGCWISALASYVLWAYLQKPVDHILLYQASDPGYVDSKYSDKPILGVHRFGDMLQMLSYANSRHPFDPNSPFPSPYPPFGVAAFKIFLWLSPIVCLISILVLGTLLLVKSYLMWDNLNSILQKMIFVVVAILLSKPVLLSLDRGNIQIIVVGLMLLSLLYLDSEKNHKAKLLLVLAISLKIYPIVLLLLPLKRKKYRFVIETLSYSGILTLVSALVTQPSSLLSIPAGILRGIGIQTNTSTSGIGLVAWIFRILEQAGVYHPRLGNDRIFSTVSLFIAAATLLWMYIFVFESQNGSYKTDGIVLIATTSLVIPVSWAYNAIWIPFLLITMINSREHFPLLDKPIFQDLSIGDFYIISLSLINIPIPWIWRGGTRIAVSFLELFLPILMIPLVLSYRDHKNATL